MRRWPGTLLPPLLALLLWELCGRAHWIADGALPPPSLIATGLWADRALYPPHIAATLRPALAGFMIGNLVAVTLASLFVLSPRFERLMSVSSVMLFALPPIAFAPVLVITLPGLWPQIVLAAILVYFPTMTATLLGLREIDSRTADVISSYGGGPLTLLRLLRLPASLPGLLSGLRIAAPAAILGAILGEFGSGSRWGLGSFLLGSLGRADPARLWGIGLSATALSALAFGAFSLLARRLHAGMQAPVLAPAVMAQTAAPLRARLLSAVIGLLLPCLLWQMLVGGSGLSSIVALGPVDVIRFLIEGSQGEAARAALGEALQESLPLAGAGLAMGLAFALLIAMLGFLWPLFARQLLAPSLLLQSMPLVALTPLLVLLFGRGTLATLMVTVSVTFFPALITISQGLAQLPRAADDLFAVYGASRWQRLILGALPGSLAHLCAAARLVAPRALLGVMTAEWLATGRGLGNLLNQARGDLDYAMIWSVAMASTLVSCLIYLVAQALERRLR